LTGLTTVPIVFWMRSYLHVSTYKVGDYPNVFNTGLRVIKIYETFPWARIQDDVSTSFDCFGELYPL